jgi:hypothetical protein
MTEENSGARELVRQAVAQAVEFTGLPATSWSATVEPVVWPGGTLGLPGVGIDMMVPGFRISLVNGERELRFHTSETRVAFAGELMPDGRLWKEIIGFSGHPGHTRVWQVLDPSGRAQPDRVLTKEDGAQIRARLSRQAEGPALG